MNTKPAAAPRVPDWWLFFNKFLRQGTGIAALAPSSPWLARAAVRGIDFGRARCIVELGAGTGPITTELLKHAGDDCRVMVVERDPDFCLRLKEKFPRADVVEADANDLELLLQQRGIDKVDHVLSGLPLPSFPEGDRNRLIAAVQRCLAPQGTMRQLTHMPYVYFKLYRRYFDSVRFELVPMNVPPGGIYICSDARVMASGGR